MTKKIIAAIIIVFICVSYSQSQAKFLVGPAGGITLPTMDYSGETTDFYAGTSYGLKTGFNIGILGKFSILKILNGRAGITYSSLEHSGLAEAGNAGSSATVKNNIF